MNSSVKTDDVIFNFFKQICDEKDDQKCVELGKNWIEAMETNLSNMEANLNGADIILFDTAGRTQIDLQMMSEIKQIENIIKPAETFLVADSHLLDK